MRCAWLSFLKLGFIALAITAQSCQSSAPTKREAATLRLEIVGALLRAGNFPTALKELLIAEQEDPTNPYVQAHLGYVYFLREKYDSSEKHYLQSLKLKPDYPEAKTDLARTYIEMGRFVKAETLLKQALEDLTFVKYHKAQAMLGVLEFKKKNYAASQEYLKKALEKDREDCPTNVFLGRSYTEGQELKLAIQQLEKSMAFCALAESDEAHYYSAIALYRDNQIDKAQLRFEEQLKLFPNGYYNEKAGKMIELIKKGRL